MPTEQAPSPAATDRRQDVRHGYGLILVALGLGAEERELVRKFWRRVFGGSRP